MKRLAALLVVILLCFPLFGCFSESEKELPKLIIGCEEYRPYIYTDQDGDPAGMDAELAAEACRRIGYEPVFKVIDWKRHDEILTAGEVDCLWSCFQMDEQEENYAWVGPYMFSRQVVAVRSDSPINSLNDLNGKNIAVKVGSDAENLFLHESSAQFPQVGKVFCLDEMDSVISALRNNYVDACAGHAASLRVYLQNADVSYRFLDEDLTHAKLGIAFPKDSDSELRSKLNNALLEMAADGTTERILAAYGVDTQKALAEGMS